jgi:hypothetical protein
VTADDDGRPSFLAGAAPGIHGIPRGRSVEVDATCQSGK